MWLKANVTMGGGAMARVPVNYDGDSMAPVSVEWPERVPMNAEVSVNGAGFFAVGCIAQGRQFEVTIAAAPLLPEAGAEEAAAAASAIAETPMPGPDDSEAKGTAP